MADTFALQLGRFAEKAKGNAQTVVRKVSTDVLTKVVMRTPVGNRELWAANIERKKKGLPLYPAGYVGGRLRANWNTSFGAPSFKVTNEKDPTGQGAIMRGTSTINRAYGDHDIYITNALPYAIPIEYGHSSQARNPQGMVRVTVTEFQTYVDNAVAGLPK